MELGDDQTFDGSINETNFVRNFKQLVIFNSALAPFYLLFLLIPSLLLNGTIIGLFMKKKELQSPLNLLIINQSFYSILSNILNGFLILVAIPIFLGYGSCAIEPVIVATTHWTHFGVSSVNITAISIGIYVTLKYNSSSKLKPTYRRVFIVIAVVWVYPGLWAISLAYITRNITSLRCQLYTDDFELPSGTGLRELFQVTVYIARIFTVNMVCRILVVIFCIASYKLFRNSTINPPEGLTRRMLLLPILMIIMTSIVNFSSELLLVGLNNGYGGVTVSVEQFESSPLYYIPTIFQLLLEYDAIAYACLLIYLNKKLQSTFIESIKAMWVWCKHPNHNTVAPQ